MIQFGRILCPTDFSEASLEAFPYAMELARLFKAEILFIYVVPVLPPAPADFGFESEVVEFVSALHFLQGSPGTSSRKLATDFTNYTKEICGIRVIRGSALLG